MKSHDLGACPSSSCITITPRLPHNDSNNADLNEGVGWGDLSCDLASFVILEVMCVDDVLWGFSLHLATELGFDSVIFCREQLV